jgi:outer membrane receptor protein involved in Fe transport
MWTDTETKTYNNTYSYADALQGRFSRGAQTKWTGSKELHSSPFVHLEFSPITRLRLSLGTRLDNIEYSIYDKMATNKDAKKTFAKSVVKAGATFDLDSNNLLWARAAEGFLAPSVSTLLGSGTPGATHAAAVTNQFVPADMSLKPEESMTYELGLRGKLPAHGLGYDIVYYDTDIKNLVVQEDCGITELCYRRNVNAGKANLHGVETALSYSLTRWLDVAVSHTYSVVKYTDYVTPTFNYTGNTWKNAPTQHYNIRLAFKPAPGWRIELSGDHNGAYFLNNENQYGTYKRPDLFNLRANYTAKDWSAWLHVLNLLDTKYGERVQTSGAVRTFGDGYQPLAVRAGVSYKF